jgi:hypothetical protein
MHARKLIVLAMFSLVMGLAGSARADDKAAPAPAAAEHKCPHAKHAGGDCPCKHEGAKADCPHAKSGDCPCKKEGAKADCPHAKSGDCPCKKEGAKADCPCAKGGECACPKGCKCPHCQPGDAKPDDKADKADKADKKAKKTK